MATKQLYPYPVRISAETRTELRAIAARQGTTPHALACQAIENLVKNASQSKSA